jgi:hypothetical protein
VANSLTPLAPLEQLILSRSLRRESRKQEQYQRNGLCALLLCGVHAMRYRSAAPQNRDQHVEAQWLP